MFPLLTVASSKGPAEHQGNQGPRRLDGYHTPGMTQCIPIASGPPGLCLGSMLLLLLSLFSRSPTPFLSCTCSLSDSASIVGDGQ
jgi:hypothetical protein